MSLVRNYLSVAFLLLSFPLYAEDTPLTDVSRLDKDLTPLGAMRAGNKDGSIPAWTGGITQAPENYEPGDFHPDPYFQDKVKFKVDHTNIAKHQSKLTEGQIALLKKFPDLYLNVYPSRRSASYPGFVYDALKQNAASAKLLDQGTGVTDTIMTSPFPIPQDGLEALWNHTLRYRGQSFAYEGATVATTPGGDFNSSIRAYQYFFAYSEPGVSLQDIDNKIFYLKRKTIAPAKLAGTMTLVHETLDQVRSPRKSWIYVTGQRRVRRTPNLSYDTQDNNTDGIRTIDQVDMFNGAPNFYTWKLVGKQEKYVPYNAYKVHGDELSINDIVGPQHLNPEHLRYELHRVWVVEAELRTGIRHIYQKRRFYFDEDSWQIIYSEQYNKKGELWQIGEAHTINYYDVPLTATTLETTYDLLENRYFTEGLDNERKGPYDFRVDLDKKTFKASAMRREARR